MNILIMDDEEVFRRYVRQAVEWERFGDCAFHEAKDGREALLMAESTPFDMVLADIEMPRMDGLASASAIKKLQPESEIILISGHDKFSYAQKALKIGISDFLVKPVSREALEAALEPVIQRILERRRTRLDQYKVSGMLAAESYARETGYVTYSAADGEQLQMAYPYELHQKLSEAMGAGDGENVTRLLSDYAEHVERSQVPPECVSNLSLGFVTTCLRELKKMNIPPEQVFPPGFAPYQELSCLSEPGQILSWLTGMYTLALGGLRKKVSVRAERLVREAKRRIDEQYGDPDFNIAELAKSMYVNEGYIRQMFRETESGTPSGYLREVRMRAALVLIREKGRSVLDAARLAGFRDSFYFSKCFKQYYGYAPSYYERESRSV